MGSLTKTKWILQNSPGLGDASFRGNYQYRFRALPTGINIEGRMPSLQKGIDYTIERGVFTYPEFPFKVGDRIGQVYLEEVIPMEFKIVDENKDV